MEQLFSAGKAYLKINSLVKTPLHKYMAVERSGLWAPDHTRSQKHPGGFADTGFEVLDFRTSGSFPFQK